MRCGKARRGGHSNLSISYWLMDRLITGESSDPLVVVLFLNYDKKMKSNMC